MFEMTSLMPRKWLPTMGWPLALAGMASTASRAHRRHNRPSCISPQEGHFCPGQKKRALGTTCSKNLGVQAAGSTGACNHPLFKSTEVFQDVWLIEERFFDSWNKANIFFVSGSSSDLLIDTGAGMFNISTYLETSGLRPDTRKPMEVVLTHTHFDHSGGAHHFDNPLSRIPTVSVHRSEAKVLLNGCKFLTASWVTKDEVVPKPTSHWSARDYHVPPITKVKEVNDGDSFNLGNFNFKVLHLPGHTRGSIGLLDANKGLLVTGDTLYKTEEQLIDWYPGGSSVSKMCSSVSELLRLLEADSVHLVLPGHNDIMGKVDAMDQCRMYLMRAKTFGHHISKGFSRLKVASIIYLNARFEMPEVSREWLKS